MLGLAMVSLPLPAPSDDHWKVLCEIIRPVDDLTDAKILRQELQNLLQGRNIHHEAGISEFSNRYQVIHAPWESLKQWFKLRLVFIKYLYDVLCDNRLEIRLPV